MAFGVAASEPISVDLYDPVLSSGRLTYDDLAKQLLPDLEGDKSAEDKTPGPGIRHLGGQDMMAGAEKSEPGPISRLDLNGPSGKRTLLLFDFGNADGAAQSVSILALYDVSGTEPRLLDAVDVGFDRFTSFEEPNLVFPAPEVPVAFFRSSHFNAGEAYVQTSLVSLAGDRLSEVDTIATMNWNGCAWSIESELGFRVTRGTIRATINVRKTKLEGEGCAPGRYERKLKAGRLDGTYVWEAGRKRFKARTAAFKNIPFPGTEE